MQHYPAYKYRATLPLSTCILLMENSMKRNKKVMVSVFVRKEHLPPLVVLAAEIPLCVGAGESRWTLRACARGDDVDVDHAMS